MQNDKLAYKSAITESTGNAFFVKSQENTHAGTKDTLSARQGREEIMCLFHTHLYPLRNGFAPILITAYCIVSPKPVPPLPPKLIFKL